MAEDDRADEGRDDGPSLELPSFGFRRKKRKQDSPAARGTTPAPEAESTPAETGPSPTPVPDVESAPAPEPVREPEPAEPVQEPTPVPEPEPAPASEAAPATEPEREPAPVEREPDTTPTTIFDTDQPAATGEHPLFTETTPAAATAVDPGQAEREREPAEPEPRKDRGPLRVGIGALPGASITGAVVGLVTVGLTWGALRICEVIRGASSCGGTGLFVLLLILVAMIFLGALLLRTFRVSDPGSTSFLAIGLLAVVALLFLIDLLFNWWMIIVIPCVALLTYTLSSWVTTSFVDTDRD